MPRSRRFASASTRVASSVVVVTLLFAVGCGGSTASTAEVAVQATPVPEPTEAPGPTAAPEPTSAPEPTAPPEPTTAPEPAAAESAGYDFSSISPIVEQYIDENDLNGAGLAIVHRDDGLIHHEHWGVFDEDRVSLIASSSKMIAAGVLLRLADDGLLDIDAPVSEVAEWGSGNPDITPAQLISNSSGLVGLGPNPLYSPYICQYMPGGTLQDCASGVFTTPDDDADITAPDIAFNYGGAQWQVAGAVAEVASGKSWDDLINEIYVEPCGLESLAFNNHFSQMSSGFSYPDVFNSDPSQLAATENPNIEGGAYVTTGDYAKLLLMHLQGGTCGDTQVLSQDALDRMHGDRIGDVYDGYSSGEDWGYGMGWWVDRTSGRITDDGAYGTVPWLALDDGYGAYLVIEATSAEGRKLAEQLYPIVHEAIVS